MEILLIPKVDLATVSLLKDEWLMAGLAHKEIGIDCSAVEVFSAAAAQMIISLSKTLKASGATMMLHHIPESLHSDFTTLGLHEFFKEHVPHV